MRLHQIRNATIILEYNGTRFLIDPMFAPKGTYPPITSKSWPFHDLPISPKDIIKNIDAVILTHLHTDHFDKYAQDILPKDTKIFVQDIFDKNALEKENFENLEVLNPEGTVYENIKLYKIPCRHGEREFAEPIFLANGMRWEAMGVVFEAENEPTIYIAGDTILYDGVKFALDTFRPKYTVVNSAYTLVGKNTPVLMGIEDLKALHKYSTTKIIASHLDSVDNGTLFRADLHTSDVTEYIYTPADGEIMTLE